MGEKKQRSAASPFIGADVLAGIEEAQRTFDAIRKQAEPVQAILDAIRKQAEPVQAELEREQSSPARFPYYMWRDSGGTGHGRSPEAAREQAMINQRTSITEMELEAAKPKAKRKAKPKRGTTVTTALIELARNPKLNDSEIAQLVGCAPSTLCTSKRFQQGAATIREQCDTRSLTQPVRRSRRDNTRTNQDPEPSTSRRASEDPMADVDARLDARGKERNTKNGNSK